MPTSIYLVNSTDREITVGNVTLDTATEEHVHVHIPDQISSGRTKYAGNANNFIKDGTYTATINGTGAQITFEGNLGGGSIVYTARL